MHIRFRRIDDTTPNPRLEELFTAHRHAYQRWISRADDISTEHCIAMLRLHMPELLDTFDHLLERVGGDRHIARFLTLYNPPRVVRACTQLIHETPDGPVLLRSYDHDPRLIDALVLKAQWRSAQTLAVTDCLWGALDGINEQGLAIALAFGGRNAIGNGFAAPLICRYILETCTNVADARTALARLPVYMPYTFAVLDATGNFVTAFLSPDREATFVTRRASANHQGTIEWNEYARFVRSADRLARAETLAAANTPPDAARNAFLSAPIWRTNYGKASGTLYVAEYSPARRTLTMLWPTHTEHIALDHFTEADFTVTLPNPTSTRGAQAPTTPASGR